MALQNLPILIPVETLVSPLNQLQTFTALDAAGEKFAFILRVPKAGSIHRVHWRTATVTTAQPVRVSLETVNTSGDPSGTNYGGSTPGVESAPTSNASFATMLVADATAVYNDLIAVVFQWDSTAGNLQIAQGGNFGTGNSHYADNFVASWAKNAGQQPYCALEYSDGSFANTPFVTFGVPFSVSPAANGSPSEFGNRFQLSCPSRLCAVFLGHTATAGRDFSLFLYDDASNVLASKALLAAQFQGAVARSLIPFDTPIVLAKNTWYRLAYKPATNIGANFYGFTLPSAAAMDVHDMGQNCYRTHRTAAGAWTDVTTERFWILPIFDQFDSGGGGGNILQSSIIQRVLAQ